MAKFLAIRLDDFQRVFDQLFDDLLIERWRLAETAGASEHAIVRDYGDRYEVRIALGGADPADVQIEVGEQRLTVRVPEAAGVQGGVFSFSAPVDRDAVTAKAFEGTLTIVLPKKPRLRRVRLAGG